MRNITALAEPAAPAVSSHFMAGLWRLADPKVSLASLSAILLGACAAAAEGNLQWGWLALTVLGILALEMAKNASGEVFDFDSGADTAVAKEDRSPFSGGKRVLVDKILTRGQTIAIAAVSYGVAIAIFVVFLWHQPRVLWIGVIGLFCAYFYHAPPLKLSYRGLGEAAVALCYGPLICSGTYLVQTGRISLDVLAVSVPLGLLIAAFLWINEFPDYLADRSAAKRTLVVQLGRDRAAHAFVGIYAIALLAVVVLPAFGLPVTVWLGVLSFGPAFAAARRLLHHRENTAEVIPAQVQALRAFVLYAIAVGFGLLLRAATAVPNSKIGIVFTN